MYELNSESKSETLERKFFRYAIGLEWSQQATLQFDAIEADRNTVAASCVECEPTIYKLMYCEYKIEIMLRNIVMTVLLLQNYQLLELQLDQMIGRLLSVFSKWWF